MNRGILNRAGGILLGVAMLVVLTACSGSTGAATVTQPANSQPATRTTNALPQATATSAPVASATSPANPQTTSQPANQSTNDPLAQGKLIFEKTAGGTGCAYCHGLDGKGQGPSGLGAPPNRGASESKVRAALAGAVPVMSFIKLTEEEITAVVAYLRYLGEQP